MNLDRTSVALSLLMVGTAFLFVQRKDTASAALAGMSAVAFVGYDRWHDGLWPFTDRQRQIAGGYA